MVQARQDLRTYSRLVEHVYDSAFDGRAWEDFLSGLAQALNAKSGLFRVVDERTRTLRSGVYHNLDEELQAAYRSYFVAQDPIVEALTHAPDVYIAPGEAFLDVKAYRQTEFFNEYARPQDNHHICGGLAMRNSEFTIKFGVQRDRRTGPFSWSDAEFIRHLVPHIQRAARLGHLLQVAERRATSGDRALEAMAVAVVLVDDQCGVLNMNEKAENMIREGHGLTQREGVLRAAQARDSGMVNSILSVAIGRARGGGPAAPEAALLGRSAKGQPRLVVALPLLSNDLQFSGPWPAASAAIFLCNLDEAGLLNREVLIRLYGLTEREAQLAITLSRGETLQRVACEWQVSTETVRPHLKRVLAKTGTSRQSELVRLLTGKPWSLLAETATNNEAPDGGANHGGPLAALEESGR